MKNRFVIEAGGQLRLPPGNLQGWILDSVTGPAVEVAEDGLAVAAGTVLGGGSVTLVRASDGDPQDSWVEFDEPQTAGRHEFLPYRLIGSLDGGMAVINPAVASITIAWSRQAVQVAGAAVLLAVNFSDQTGHIQGLTLSGPPYFGGQYGTSWSPPDLKPIMDGAWINLPVPDAQPYNVVSDGQLEIALAVPGALLAPSRPADYPANMIVQAKDAQGNVLAGYPLVDILTTAAPRDVPLVAQPSIYVNGYRAEIVWPAAGAPYLHVVQGAITGGSAAQHFHLPLTPGLP